MKQGLKETWTLKNVYAPLERPQPEVGVVMFSVHVELVYFL
jgi:hypothetical protein